MAAPRGYQIVRAASFLLYIIGIVLSIYAYYVEFYKARNKAFVAACDISETMSCSKVFTSKYGKGFGLLEYITGRDHWLNLPNSAFGIAFYAIQVILTMNHTVEASVMQVVFSVTANFGSVYLAYILYFVLEDFCIVCVSMYVINFFVLLCNIAKWRYLVAATSKRSASQRVKKTQ